MNITLNLPLNNVSFGQTSVAIVRELFKRNIYPSIVPIGPVDISSQKPDDDFTQKLNSCIGSAPQRLSRYNKSIKLWHINGALESYSSYGNDLITFFELDQLTGAELNILRQQRKIYVTSSFTQDIFKQFGINAEFMPLGFDAYNFFQLSNRPQIDDVISFLMVGKLEMRKGHFQVLKAWANKYGNNRNYRLNCAIHNGFISPELQQQLISQALEGKSYWNIKFHQWLPTNIEYNSILQSSQIVLCLSGGEGRDLPCYHATALGAWPIALKAHAYLDYLNDDNAILVNPNGKRPAADGMFFAMGQPFNSGNLFTFSDEDFYQACDIAEKRVKDQGLNVKGMELKNIGFEKTVDVLLKGLE